MQRDRGALRRRRPLSLHHRHGAVPLRAGAIPLFRAAASEARRRFAGCLLAAPVARRQVVGGTPGPARALAGQPRRVAGAMPRGRADPADAAPPPLWAGRLERVAPRPLWRAGVPAPGRHRPRPAGRGLHGRRVHHARAAAPRAVPGDHQRDRAGPRPRLHHPRPAGAVAPGLVRRAHAPRSQRAALGPPSHARPRLPRREMKPFEEIVTEHGALVLRVCRALVGPADAADAWSETFLSALQAYPRLPAGSNVRGWLVTIAHRKAVDQLRGAARRPDPVRELPEVAAPEPADDEELRAALDTLPPKQRGAVVYRHLAGLSYAEVGKLLGSNATAARRSAADGIANLRKRLSKGTP